MIAGALSGFFGGFAGEQGGLRAVGLLGFDLRKEAFVATSTVVGVVIDMVRTPIYLTSEWHQLVDRDGLVAAAIAGVLLGTWIGRSLLQRVPESAFKRVLGGLLVVIGGLLFVHR